MSRSFKLATLLTAAVIAGCSGGSVPGASGTSAIPTSLTTQSAVSTTAIDPSTKPSAAPNPLASFSAAGLFAVDTSGRKLALRCWGNGGPTVFLETGGPGIDEFKGGDLVRLLAAKVQVCLYNRAGRSPSEAAPNQPREAEDVAADFHALTRAANIAPPYVLFGRSFGGMLVTFYASKYPEDVAGVVVFDSPAPSATMTLAEFPEGVWNYPDNVERLNVLTGFENRFGKTPVHMDAPLVLVSTTAGESRPEDKYWLQTSDRSKQIVLTGGMDVIDSQAEALAAQILSLVDGTAFPSPS